MKAIKKECKNLFQAVIVLRDPYCSFPGCGRPTEAGHHVFKRDRMGTAFDTRSGLGVCTQHHDTLQRDPLKTREIFVRRFGEALYEKLRMNSLAVVKNADMKAIKKGLIREYQALFERAVY